MSKKYTEADLKKLHKTDLVGIANKEFKLDFVADETSIPKIVKLILDAQDTEEVFDDTPAPAEGSAPAAESKASTESAPASPAPESPAPTPEPKEPETASPAPAEEAPAPAQSAPDVERIRVQSTQREANENGGFTIAFWERHPDHPGEQAWIADEKVHLVARTKAVSQALLDGKIEEVKG